MEVFKQYFYLEEHKSDKCKKMHFDYVKAMQAEKVKMSEEYSPCVVAGNELLARVLISPFMYNLAGNELTPEAIADVFNKGLSVNRLNYMDSPSDNFKIGDDMVDEWLGRSENKGKKRESPGYAVGNAEKLRRVTDPDVEPAKQIIGVYDSALPEASYHADVCLLVKPNKKLKKHLQYEVLKCFDTEVNKK